MNAQTQTVPPNDHVPSPNPQPPVRAPGEEMPAHPRPPTEIDPGRSPFTPDRDDLPPTIKGEMPTPTRIAPTDGAGNDGPDSVSQ